MVLSSVASTGVVDKFSTPGALDEDRLSFEHTHLALLGGIIFQSPDTPNLDLDRQLHSLTPCLGKLQTSAEFHARIFKLFQPHLPCLCVRAGEKHVTRGRIRFPWPEFPIDSITCISLLYVLVMLSLVRITACDIMIISTILALFKPHTLFAHDTTSCCNQQPFPQIAVIPENP